MLSLLNQVTWESVHFISSGDLESQMDPSLDTYEIDLGQYQLLEKQDLLKEISQKLEFPVYYDFTWDSLYEGMTDLSWKEERHFVLVIKNAGPLWCQTPHLANKLVTTWQTAAEHWSRSDIPFHLVFVFE